MSLRAGRQEADSINVPQAVVGFVSAIALVLLTFLGVFSFTHNVNWSVPPSESKAAAPETAPAFGMLHQTLFDTVSDAAELKKAQVERLETYGWADQGKGLAHIPIERAKKLVVEGKK